MGCVNISSREFKQLAQDNNLSSNTLELITHKYWLEKGSEDLFPSNIYIQEQLGNTQYKEKGKSIRKLWKEKYSTPQEFSSLEALQTGLKEVRKFFPQSALVHYRDAKGNFILTVKQPVERVNHDKDEFFEGDFPKNVRTMDLGLSDSEVYSIDKVEELFNRFNTDRTSRHLAEKVFKIAKDLGLNISFNESLPFGNLGRYTSNNTITYKKSFFERDWMNSLKAPILLHEVLHSLTMYALSEQTKRWEKPEAIEKFATEMNSIFQDVRNHEILKGERGVMSLREFVAELANPVFRQKLQSIDAKRNFWQRILDTFKNWLGITPDSRYYNRAMNALDKALNAFDLDTYLRYNGVRNLLQQGYRAENWAWRTLSEEELKETIKKSPYTNAELAQLVSTMSKEQLQKELQKIEQEYADYDLIHPEQKDAPKKNDRKPVPQDFTFNDGITVKAPFKPNNQQVDALNAMSDFINSDETTMTLSGYAGTGKTSLMEMLAKKMRQQHKRIVFSATTNKAAAVLKSRVQKSGFDAYTLNKVFGINVEVDSNQAYNARNLINVLKESELVCPGDVVVIDEASMINEENYKVLNQVAKDRGLKIIYVGDEAQLAPVNETQISKVFRNGDGKVIRLTQVERTDDNAILKEATALRENKPLSGESSFNNKGEGVAYIKPENKKEIGNIVKHFVKGLEDNPNYFRILAYTNAAISKYNTAVRNTLGYTDFIPKTGEPMTGYTNWGYNYKTKSYRFINSESYKVVKVNKPKTVSIFVNGQNIQMTSIPITLEDSMGNRDTFDYMDIKGNQENLQAARILAQEKARLWDVARKTVGREAKAKVYQQINAIDEFLFVNDNIIENKRTLQPKTIDFGYALTIHKSQGSTFTHVLMDDIDVSKASGSVNNAANAVNLGLDASTETSFDNTEVKNTEEVDLGDLSNVETESNTPAQIANVRQQLRYVGVSRATDTVTIISDNVKSEDSPLNHIPGIKATSQANNTINPEESRSNNGQNIPHPIKMNNLGIETGELIVQVDKSWKEEVLTQLDKELGEAASVGNDNYKETILNRIAEVKHAADRINLLNYEYYSDKTEATMIDAEWKIPRLEELDAMLVDASADQTAILDEMDRILNAATQEELNNPVSPQKKQIQQNLSEFEKITQQINNLLDSDVITASEIRHIAELVVNSISDTITDIQKGNFDPEAEFTGFSTEKDLKNATRKEIVEAVGLDRLIERAKENFDPENNMAIEDITVLEQADLIVDNWDAIMTLAADVFSANEGFGIQRNYDKGGFQAIEGTNVDFDNFNQSEDTETVEETEGDEQEHWQIESRTIDVLNSMSQLVRQALHECYLLDADGNRVMSKWGIAERVNPRKTVNSILRWTQGALSLDDMIQRLSNKAEQNPWINQLIERLSDKSGKESDFQSQFYGVFSKHFQPYSIVLLEDGKYSSIPVNSHPALTEAMQTITTQFKIGEHPLFTDKGINEKLLGTENTTYPEADFNLHKALSNLQTIVDRLKHNEELDTKMSKEATVNLMGVCRLMGYSVSEEMIEGIMNTENIQKMTTSLTFMVKSLDSALKAQKRDSSKEYNPFAYGTDNNIGGTLRNFLTPITDILEDTAINAFYDSGKMYQSYVTPSFMTKLMSKFRLEGQAFEDFIMNEYGSSEFFKFPGGDINTGWRNEWLRLLARDENARKVFDHKVELNFNKHNYMRNMSDAEYTLSLITEYFAENTQKGQDLVPAWFRIPMQSNKPSSEFIKFYSYRGNNYKDVIVGHMHKMFLQELSRIQTARMRNHSKNDSEFIKNFDSNGRKFNFLAFLNEYLDKSDSRLATLLNKKIEGLEKMTAEEEAALATLVQQAIRQHMENRAQSILDNWQNNGIVEAAKTVKDIVPSDLENEAATQWVRSQLENFLWNDNFAAKNILQLTITDIAFYKDAEDMQKRLAQLHAPGMRGNVQATDYEGNRVSDGKYRTFLLADFDSFKSNIIDNIAEVFDRKIDRAPEGQKDALRALKEELVGENGRYKRINVVDGQGYSSPASYRKKALIFGRWSKKAEEIYQKLQKGEYNYSDLETAFQPLKPFVYSHLQKNMGVDNAPIKTMNVPFQAKNSEYLLIMADAILQGEETSRPNLLRAIYRVMEESEKINPTRGIDTVQFESAVKSGLQGKIDINQFMEMPGGEEAAYTYMMSQIYQQGTTQYNTDTFVHEADYEDYCMQQEVPAHFRNHAQAHGSQIRMIIPSDLDLYKNPNGDREAEDNKVYYEWTEPDGTHKKLNAIEFRREYEETIAENIAQSIEDLSNELHINSEDKKERNIALSKILQREILSSPRYGVDLIQACSIDKETGEFRIPKGDPIQAKRIEQLINSIIKNRVNKQKIAGGPIVQVTNWGTSRQLHIRFNSKQGGLLMTREEYEANPQKKEMTQTDKFNARYKKAASNTMSYEEYVKENQAGIAYFEVFVPIWDNEIFEKFSNSDNTINMEAIEATDPELLKMISYRIPTEDKYSMAPMKAVGFMPREAGDAIMLPYELTEIDDSDFDIDKRYIMRKDIPIKKKPKYIVRKELFDIVTNSYQKKYGKELPANVANDIEVFLSDPQKEKDVTSFRKWLYSQYQKVAYTTEPATTGRTYRDNKIIDMSWAVLTNEMTADKILNPGGFDNFKKNGYMIAAYKNGRGSWGQLQGLSIDQLKELSYVEKDLTWADTQIHFYHQNAAGSNLIGIFAVNKVAHATLEGNDLFIAVDEICGKEPFTIVDKTFEGRMPVDPTLDDEGNVIGKNIGSGVSASADTAKEPTLDLMNINMTTAGVFNTMLRLGMPFEDAALMLSQDAITKILEEFNKKNLTNYESLSNIIEARLQDIRDAHGITENSTINTEPLTREELIKGLKDTVLSDLSTEKKEVIDYKVLLAFQKLRSLAEMIRKPTFATRFNSISSAVGPLIIDNLIIEHKIEQFMDSNSEDGTHFYTADGTTVDIDDIFYDHPILRQFAKTVDVAKKMFYDMPAGSTGFRNLLNNLPEGLVDKFYNDKKLLDQLSNFYQSYLLLASGYIQENQLKNYIDGFAKWFMKQNFKEKYPENELIQAIKMGVSKRTGRPYLNVNVTGADTQVKESLGNAWIDLHKADPELSQRLFAYNFFRAGVGFSPKTFMALVPTFVKERLERDLGNDTKVSYVDTYRNFPNIVPSLVIDQFIRNNWDNNKLVPKKGGEGTHYQVDLKRGSLIVRDKKDMMDLDGVTYMKTRHNGQTYLWKLIGADKYAMNYIMVKPLGSNGEYLEMSLSDIQKPVSDTTQTIEDMDTNDTTEIKETAPTDTDAEGPAITPVSETQATKDIAWFADGIMKQRESIGKPVNKTEAENMIEKMKKNPEMFGDYMTRVFKQLGVELSKEDAVKEFKKLC